MGQFLSPPQPIGVAADCQGKPIALSWRRGREPVTICNHWRSESDWWRQCHAREYYRLLTRSGSVCVIYRDAVGGGWYLQKVLD